MKTTITPRFVQEKSGARGKFWSVQADGPNGKIQANCFDSQLAQDMQNSLNKPIEVNLEQKGQFVNIESLEGSIVQSQAPGSLNQPSHYKPYPYSSSKFQEARVEKNKSMYIAYAKDLVIAGKTPKEAISIIKEFIKEFETA